MSQSPYFLIYSLRSSDIHCVTKNNCLSCYLPRHKTERYIIITCHLIKWWFQCVIFFYRDPSSEVKSTHTCLLFNSGDTDLMLRRSRSWQAFTWGQLIRILLPHSRWSHFSWKIQLLCKPHVRTVGLFHRGQEQDGGRIPKRRAPAQLWISPESEQDNKEVRYWAMIKTVQAVIFYFASYKLLYNVILCCYCVWSFTCLS